MQPFSQRLDSFAQRPCGVQPLNGCKSVRWLRAPHADRNPVLRLFWVYEALNQSELCTDTGSWSHAFTLNRILFRPFQQPHFLLQIQTI